MKILVLTMFCALGLLFLFVGSVCLLTNEFMPWHAAAIETTWQELDRNYQGLYLGFLKGLGAGAFSVGMMLIAMSVQSCLQGLNRYKYSLIASGLALVAERGNRDT